MTRFWFFLRFVGSFFYFFFRDKAVDDMRVDRTGRSIGLQFDGVPTENVSEHTGGGSARLYNTHAHAHTDVLTRVQSFARHWPPLAPRAAYQPLR